MPRTRTPYSADFRDQIVALARSGRSVERLAREFEPCAETIAGWVGRAGVDGDGQREFGEGEPALNQRAARVVAHAAHHGGADAG